MHNLVPFYSLAKLKGKCSLFQTKLLMSKPGQYLGQEAEFKIGLTVENCEPG